MKSPRNTPVPLIYLGNKVRVCLASSGNGPYLVMSGDKVVEEHPSLDEARTAADAFVKALFALRRRR